MRKLIFVLLFLLIESFVTCAFAQLQPEWIKLDTGIYEEGTGETLPAGDIVHLYFYNDGVWAFFNETLVEAPNATAFTYMVILDKPAGGAYSQDFRLLYSSTASELQRWNGTDWVWIKDISVLMSSSPPSLAFNVSLADIANHEVLQDTKLTFENFPADLSIGRKCVDFVYGECNIKVGNVCFFVDSSNLYVEIQLNQGWGMAESGLKVSKDSVGWSPPGHFPYKHEFCELVDYDLFTVPLDHIGHGDLEIDPPFGVKPQELVYLMVYAKICKGIEQPECLINITCCYETAYCCAFRGSCNYTIPGDTAQAYIESEVIPELPWPTPVLVILGVVIVTTYMCFIKRNPQSLFRAFSPF